MNIDEFKEHYKGFRWNELIVVNCTILGCDRKQSLRKSSAIRNVEKNGSFLWNSLTVCRLLMRRPVNK